jgi:hypothetical protein
MNFQNNVMNFLENFQIVIFLFIFVACFEITVKIIL